MKFLLIQGKILDSRRRSGDRLEVGDEPCAAELPSADSDPSDQAGFLPRADLLHLYPDTELFSIDLDELAEVHPAVSDVVEDGFGTVSLKLHITDFHVQPEFCGNSSRLDHSVILPGDGLLPLLDVGRLCPAVNPLDLPVVKADALDLHLPADNRSLEGHDTQILTAGRFHNHQVAGTDTLVGGIQIDPLAGVLETHFEQVLVLFLPDSIEPVHVGELAAADTVAAFRCPGFAVPGYRAAPVAIEAYGL